MRGYQTFYAKSIHCETRLYWAGPDLPCGALIEPLGRMAASLLEEILTDGCVLGVAWGRTLAATANVSSRLPKVSVVQVAGPLSRIGVSAETGVDFVYRMAAAGHGAGLSDLFANVGRRSYTLLTGSGREPAVAQVFPNWCRSN